MLTKRIIACLDVRDGQVVKGVQFQQLRHAGDPGELARRYNVEGIDEVVILDITATLEKRQAMARKPPEILVTTPESLNLLLSSPRSRGMLSGVRTVILDEIHAVAQTKRGAHLALTLERLAANAAQPIQRIGLSATQKPIEVVARFLVGVGTVVPEHLVGKASRPSGRRAYRNRRPAGRARRTRAPWRGRGSRRRRR